MDDVRENDQCLYYVAATIILMADSKEELDSMTETVETIGKRNSVTIEEHYLETEGIKYSTSYRCQTGGNHAYHADTEPCCFDAF